MISQEDGFDDGKNIIIIVCITSESLFCFSVVCSIVWNGWHR